jgi:hypothetical protein
MTLSICTAAKANSNFPLHRDAIPFSLLLPSFFNIVTLSDSKDICYVTNTLSEPNSPQASAKLINQISSQHNLVFEPLKTRLDEMF